MIFTILSILLLLYSCINFKVGIMLFVIYQIFWYPTLLFEVSGFGLNTNLLLTVSYCFLYLINKNKHKRTNIKFPYKTPFILAFCSYILTGFFALSGFEIEIARILNYIFRDYLFVWILWDTIEEKNDFKFLFKGISLVIFIASMYGLIEYIFKNNFILNYKVFLSSDTISLYDPNGLRGYRLTSLFEHPIGAGMVFGLYAVFVLVLWVNKKYIPYKLISITTSIMCINCIILTKMRSTVIFFVLCTFSIVKLSKSINKKYIYLIISVLIGSPIIIFIIKDNINLLSNLFTMDKSSDIGGSSMQMRLTQFSAIKNIMNTSPIFGLGETFRTYITRSVYTDAALGYEGILFEQAVMHGIFGVLITIVKMYYSIIKIPRKYKSKQAFWFAFAYWFVYCFSSIPSFRIILFYLAEFYFIKTSDVYKFELERKDKKI